MIERAAVGTADRGTESLLARVMSWHRAVGATAEMTTMVCLIKAGLWRRGFDRTVNACTAIRRPTIDRFDVSAHVERAAELAGSVVRWHPVPTKCLEHSLLVAWFLARRGISAEVVIGVRKYPFYAHAWTEWNGRMMTPPASEHHEHFKVISRYGGAAR